MDKHVVKAKAYINDDEYYYRIVRENIHKFRILKGLTQQNLADMTDLSREDICDIENEKRGKHPTIAVIGRIAEAMGVHIVNFFVDNSK